MSITDSFEHCVAEVRRLDYDRYLGLLFAAPDVRRGLAALYAFNLEISKVRETVTEPLIGQMRLQWWRDALDGIEAGSPPKHPVAEALADTIERYDLPRDTFETLIDARAFDLNDDPIEDGAALETYLRGTSVPVFDLGLQISSGAKNLERAQRAGLAFGYSGVLRAVKHHARQGWVLLPKTDLLSVGLSPRKVIDTKGVAALSDVVSEYVLRAEQALNAEQMPADPTLMPLAVSRLALRRIKRANFDVFAESVDPSLVRKQLAVLAARLRGRV